MKSATVNERTLISCRSDWTQKSLNFNHITFGMNVLPLNNGCSPSQSRPKNNQKHQISALDPPLLNSLIQRNSHRSSRCVAKFVNISKNLILGSTQSVCDSTHDPLVRLVRDHAFDLADINLTALHGFLGCSMHGSDSTFEGLLAVHSQKMKTIIE